METFESMYENKNLKDKRYPLILLKESIKKEIIENTTLDPDSPEAWYEKDNTGLDSDIVRVGNFTWHREKSNENVTDTREGKGFSFFYARYAFSDKNRRTVTQSNGNNRTIAKISDLVYTVIDTQDDRDLTRIISAWMIEDLHSKWVKFYFQGGIKIEESVAKYGEPIYVGASDELSEIYFKEASK